VGTYLSHFVLINGEIGEEAFPLSNACGRCEISEEPKGWFSLSHFEVRENFFMYFFR